MHGPSPHLKFFWGPSPQSPSGLRPCLLLLTLFKTLNPLTFANFSPSNHPGLLAHHYIFPCLALQSHPLLQPLLCLRCTSSLERTPKRPPSVCTSSQPSS